MSRARTPLFALAFLAAACGGSEQPSSAPATRVATASTVSSDTIAGEYLVVLRDRPAPLSASATLSQSTAIAVATGVDSVAHVYTSPLRGFHAKGVDADELIRLLDDPRVARVVPNIRVRALETTLGKETQFDPPWGLDRIDQRSNALDRAYTYEATGQGVDVIILDSGIRSSHREFASGRIEILKDWIGDGLGGADCDGHGTHVAGTVGGQSFGVSKGVRLRVGRVLNCVGDGDWLTVIAAIDEVRRAYLGTPAAQRRPTVLSLSLGSRSSFREADEAINAAVRAGIVVVAAAGNEGADACTSSPGSAELAITVAASNKGDRRWLSSNYGPCVDIFAPGDSISSAAHTSDDAAVLKSGTSMAVPHVSGAVALFLQRNPTASPARVQAALVSAAIESVQDGRSGAAGLLHVVF